MRRSHPKKSGGAGRKNVLNMMGYGDEEDDDDDDAGMEAELAAILGGGSQPKSYRKKKPSKLLDWSIIDAQVASSMRDVDEDSDDEVTAEDENELLGELNDLMSDEEPEKEPALLKPAPVAAKARAPSPQPSPGSTLELLKDRKQMYETAIANAQATGQSSKVRRLQRGVKTLEGLLRTAKAGRPVKEDDIPPPVATGQQAGSTASAASTSQNVLSSSPKPLPVESPLPKAPPSSKVSSGIPTPLVQVAPASPVSPKVESKPVDSKTLQLLEARQHEYRDAALAAKKSGNKEEALKYFRMLKQFDPVIEAAKNGQEVDLSKMPPSLKSAGIPAAKQPSPAPQHSSSPAPQQAQTTSAAASGSQSAAPSRPKTVLEALEQRMAKYQSSSDEATKEGNGGKARRMGRIVKQYKDAIRAHKLGKPVNLDELPVPPGFPPIPGMKEADRQENLMQKATALIHQSTEEEPGSSRQAEAAQGLSAPAAAASQRLSPQRIGDSSVQRKASPKQAAKAPPSTRYEKQIAFLENRQAAFKRAALDAKQRNDRAAALDYLRKMKGFDEMIEAAKGGIKVDITHVPQPPAEFSSPPKASRDEGFEVIEDYEIPSRSGPESSKSSSPEEDDALFSRLFESLEKQVKKARAYAQQMTHSGDVSGAERADRLAASSQADLDYVRSCRRHGDSPPRFFYQNEVFEMIRMNPDLGSDDLELTIVQCIDLRCAKDSKVFVEFEMPFPHDNPIKSKTEEGRGASQNLQFPGANFRVPFNRKLKSNHRAIKNKAIKIEVVQKGGFLRSDKSIASTAIKLNPLENHCEIHAIEELKDGRNVIGKIEAYVKLRTPLLSSDSQTVKERWLSVEHVKRVRRSAPMPSSNKPSKPSTTVTKSSGTSPRLTASDVSIAALPVLELDLKIVSARIAECRRKKTSSREYEKEALAIQERMESTKKYLKEGASHARSEYVNCLTSHYEHLNKEAQIYAKQGKKEQARLALTKRSLVKKELEKYQAQHEKVWLNAAPLSLNPFYEETNA